MSISNMTESQFSDEDDNLKLERNSAGYHYHSQDVSFFQICQSCFWCASVLYEPRMVNTCPVCTSERMDSLPITPKEAYTYDISESAGLSLSSRSLDSRR
jgi:hypothetical protein